MKAGLMFANRQQFSRPELFSQLARDAEELGFESIWTVEHVVVPVPHTPYPGTADGRMRGGDDAPIPDPLIPLAYAAALTTKLKLATGIVILPQRNPVYLAKEIATLDVLSHGRVILGIGSGWMKEEFKAVGIDFHERGARTDESIQAIRALWHDTPASFDGKHFKFGPAISSPKPVQKGGVPIHVGGHSAAAARRAGRFGNGFFPNVDVAKYRELTRLMREAAKKAGRNPEEIELTAMTGPEPDKVKAYLDAGATRIVFDPLQFDPAKLRAGLEGIANKLIAKS
jgi:probable F420-dependent oxidoreductase